MADTVTTVADESRILLNDVGKQLYTDTILLPYVNKAYEELQSDLNKNGIQTTKEVSALFIVTAGVAPVLTTNDITNLIQPLALFERPSGSTSLFNEMIEKDWEPEIDRTDQLRYWVWRENEIKFVGALIDVQVKVRYRKSLSTLISGASAIGIIGAKQFLAARAAAVAAFAVGGSETRATTIQADAENELAKFITSEVKRNQRLVVRRKPFRRSNFL